MVAKIDVNPQVMDFLSHELLQYGFDDFCFGLFNLGDEVVPKLTSFSELRVKLHKRQKHLVVSSDRALTIRNDYFNYYANYDGNFSAKRLKLGINVWDGPDLGCKPGRKLNQLYDEYGVHSIVNWLFPTQVHWLGAFHLFSSHSRAETIVNVKKHEESLHNLLEVISQYFSSVHIKELNPIANFSGISDKSMAVLKLIAAGKTLEEISKELYLTTRGVCYHIDYLKVAFECTNRNHLVDKAHRLGLLS